MSRRDFEAPVRNGVLRGWVAGAGRPVLLLHGGPGMSFTYMDEVADELVDGYEVATYQQRGLAPSSLDGPFDVATHVEDIAGVLDALGWDRTTLVGNSWGGHLALHAAVAMGDRLDGVLCIDPLGGVGDGGEKEFEAAMFARTPEDVREKAAALDARAMAGEGTPEDALESLRLVWPAYYADWTAPHEMPATMTLSLDAYARSFESLHEELPRLTSSLPSVTTPVGFLAGAGSPMPVTASTATAAAIPGAWTEIVEDAGHFIWLEQPGRIRAAVDRLHDA
ncbi:MAG TPA: alpha/beta hydrolase [Mycobacteriales bacterium]|nr:alpha/beta hydrolase [Mycobacteriales bacterium]